jgi:hypothetical protein
MKKNLLWKVQFLKKKPFYWCWSIIKIWNLNIQILFIFSYDIFRNKNSSSQISQSKVVRCSPSVTSSRVNVTKQIFTINMHHLWIVRKQFSRIQIVNMLSPQQDVHLQVQWYPTPISAILKRIIFYSLPVQASSLNFRDAMLANTRSHGNCVDFGVQKIKRIALFSRISNLLVWILFSKTGPQYLAVD